MYISAESRIYRTTSACLIGTPLTFSKRLEGGSFLFVPLNVTVAKLMEQYKLKSLSLLRCVFPVVSVAEIETETKRSEI